MKHFYLVILLICCTCFFSGAKNQLNDEQNLIKRTYNASNLEWKLWGFNPESWRWSMNSITDKPNSVVRGIPITIPGSVQLALRQAGIIKDWNIGLNHQDCEWVENRNWVFSTKIPDDWLQKNKQINLVCNGLDDNGVVLVNGKEAGQFNNSFIPFTFDLNPFIKDSNNTIQVVFNPPPRYIGTPYFTSKIKDWKPRFYYVWDWMPRNVQIGIWDDIIIEVTEKDQVVIDHLNVSTTANRFKDQGELTVSAEMTPNAMKGKLAIELKDKQGRFIINEIVPCTQIRDGKVWTNLKVNRWFPNGQGEQFMYRLECTLYDERGNIRQETMQNIGFKNICWETNTNAPNGADPWLCVVNNKPLFLQGVNWTPIRPNFADLREEDYRKLITTYKNLGVNIFRVWGGAIIEKKWFYDLCDEMGILLWQEFPLSSSGFDNYPPETAPEIQAISVIARSYIKRLRHHVSLLMWCGGNELYEYGDTGIVTDKHPMIRSLKEIVKAEDPQRRFVSASPSGINIWGGLDNFGKGINWDTHGPWSLPFTETDKTMSAVENYWQLDDALMHSEVGVAGASSAELINKYKGNYPALPANRENPLWNRFNWWIEWDEYKLDHQGKIPDSIEEYVEWSQKRQTQGLTIALTACKKRFPACGGFIIWMGHDSYPCTANTSIIDFDGNPKPAALALSKIWKND